MTKPLTQTTGRRKEAVARVRLRPGTGAISVNSRPFEDYFPVATHRMLSSEALRVTSTEEVYDVDATIAKAMEINDVPVVVDFRVHRDAMVWPMVAAGTSNDDIKYARDLAPDFDEDEL